MEYIKGKPFFCQSETKIKQFPYLNKNIKTDVLIIGGGVDGIILNYYLQKDYNCVLVDKSRLGAGCTSCATVLLEYQLDDYAKDLLSEMTEDEIVKSYRMGLEAIGRLDNLISEIGNECHYAKKPSLLYSNNIFDVPAIKAEFEFRKQQGFNVEYYDSKTNPFPFKIKGGLYCPDGGAEFNAYLFCSQLVNTFKKNKVFENTDIESIIKSDDKYIATTTFGETITANKVVIATGFNWEAIHEDSLCDRFITYTIVTNPLHIDWKERALIQDTQMPYHYFRILPDDRIIFGGEDTTYKKGSIKEDKARQKYNKLLKDLKKMFPKEAENIKAEYEFCGFFGQTDNNLGLIGRARDEVYYFLSCGANGIINAFYGIDIIKAQFEGKQNEMEHLFAPLRYLKE